MDIQPHVVGPRSAARPASPQVAVYWDFENFHAAVHDEVYGEGTYRSRNCRAQEVIVDVAAVVDYAQSFGSVVVNRAYANWQWFGRYHFDLQDHALDMVQLFPLNGLKNGADIQIAIDIVDDLTARPAIETVVVVSSDSDFSAVGRRCRAQANTFAVVGTQHTNERYRRACSDFYCYSPAPPSTEERAIVLPGPATLAPVDRLVDR